MSGSEKPQYCIKEGVLCLSGNALIPLEDRGFLLGDGLFETMRVFEARVPYLKYHWQRLVNSAKQLRLCLPFDYYAFRNAVTLLIAKENLTDAGLRLTVTRGIGKRGLIEQGDEQGYYFLHHFKLSNPLLPWRLIFSSIRSNETSPLVKHKSLSYLEPIFVKKEAIAAHADDALRVNSKGYLTETSCANFFMVQNGVLRTPKIADGVLPGVMRRTIFGLCHNKGIPIEEASLVKEDLNHASEIFISNALYGLIAVSDIEAHHFSQTTMFTALQSTLFKLY